MKNCEFWQLFFIPSPLFAVTLEMHEWWVTNKQFQCDERLFGANNQGLCVALHFGHNKRSFSLTMESCGKTLL